VDAPTAAGIVLIGDAAGHNDPVTGQGLSIAARDVRMVSDILVSTKDCDQIDLAPYVDERRERMRRLRIAGRLATKIRVEFGDDARERRARVSQRAPEGARTPIVSIAGDTDWTGTIATRSLHAGNN
jgi:2-polyprenyl-6-methoxyphenol hydroxylase-like FAD-dependent oxidoreductase